MPLTDGEALKKHTIDVALGGKTFTLELPPVGIARAIRTEMLDIQDAAEATPDTDLREQAKLQERMLDMILLHPALNGERKWIEANANEEEYCLTLDALKEMVGGPFARMVERAEAQRVKVRKVVAETQKDLNKLKRMKKK